eukprot:2943342-Karenia_brevis.AAC.1
MSRNSSLQHAHYDTIDVVSLQVIQRRCLPAKCSSIVQCEMMFQTITIATVPAASICAPHTT